MQLRTALVTVLGVALAGCAKPASERPAAAPASGSAASPPEGAPPDATAPPGTAPATAPPGTAPPVAIGPGAAPAAPERHGPPLPELSVKSFGLHVGGSAADAAARADFLRALEAGTPSYLDCYRAIEVPGSVGTFGADLTIGGSGGKAKVGKPRTKLRGDAFQTCMVRALESVSFARTPSGRTVVVSYSVKFNLSD
ncbi:MAG TPA: hypothetical protein VNN72_02635 [Polyangiaceae bacterium]|nr:hypothetical protein [Polyangiaceae bacterium]